MAGVSKAQAARLVILWVKGGLYNRAGSLHGYKYVLTQKGLLAWAVVDDVLREGRGVVFV